MDTLIAFLVAAIAGALFLRSTCKLEEARSGAHASAEKGKQFFARTYLAASPY